jgi:hypothetical protein
MKPEKQQMAIASACGWTNIGNQWISAKSGYSYNESDMIRFAGDFTKDLNAMSEATCRLSRAQYAEYGKRLTQIVARDNSQMDTRFQVFDATASQRAEAFLKTIGKWEGA